jgi:phage major head subunit gpT-like protein
MSIKITTATLEGLNTTIRTTFYNAYEGYKPWADRVVTVVPSESASNTYPLSVDPGPVREWSSGERVIKSLELGSYQIFNTRYEKTLGINRDQLADDVTGALLMRARMLGSKFRKHPDRKVADIIKTNPLGLDGVALFSASHPRNPAKSDGKVYSNLFGSSAFSATNLAAARANLMNIQGPDGEPLDIDPRLIIVPPDLEYAARTVAFGTIIPSSAGTAPQSNVLVSMFDVLVVPQLVDPSDATTKTTWYLADVSTEDRPFIMQPRDPLEVVMLFDPKDPNVFKRNEYVWGGTVRYGFGPGSPYRIAKCTVA